MSRMSVLRYDIPLHEGVRFGPAGPQSRPGLLIEVHGGGGHVGRGEAAPPCWIDGTDMKHLEAELRSFAQSAAAGSRPGAFLDREFRTKVAKLSPAARCAVETAVLDLDARNQGVSVAELLGGEGNVSLEVGALVAGDSAAEVRRHATALVARGFRVLKLKVGSRDPQTDIECVEAAREAGRGEILLRLDANRFWHERQATEVLAAVASPDIEYVEEPLDTHDPAALAGLRRRTGVPIALDESVTTEEHITRAAEAAACDTIVLKLSRVGGPRQALWLARRAHACGLRVAITDSIETSVGQAAALHVAAALPRPRSAVGLGGAFVLARDPILSDLPQPSPRAIAHGPGLRALPS
jgi:o-succinylbenzoate synthase